MAEAGQQVAARLVRVGGEAVKAEPVDQQVGHLAALVFARHVAVELLIDNLQLFRGQGTGVLVGTPQRAIIEQLLAPDVGADEREIAPAHAEGSREPFLQRPQCALSRSGGSLGVDHDGPLLRRQQLVTLLASRLPENGIEALPDHFAPMDIAGHVGRK